MSSRVHVLIVEDRAAQAAWLEKTCVETLAPSDLLVEVAGNAGAALELLEWQHFDLAICDLAIPANAVSLSPDRQHGLGVVRVIREKYGGLPLIIVSEHSDDPALMRTLIREAGTADPYGANADFSMLVCFPNEELPECKRELAEALSRSAGVAQLPVTGADAARLTTSEVRAIQVFARSCGGSEAHVAGMAGGMSGATTLRLTVLGAEGQETALVAAKLGPRERVFAESNAHRQLSIMLPVGLGVPLSSTVDAGAGSQGGAFYALAVDYKRDLFECLEHAPADAAAVVRSLREQLAPVYEKATQLERTMLQLRRDIVRSADARDAGPLESAIRALDGRNIVTTNCLQHGDMHGKNVLVNSACRPMLIDYADVRRTTGCLDPVTLELSAVFHPAAQAARLDWPTEAQSAAWSDLDNYLENCPFQDYVRACREWTTTVAATPEEVDAVVLSYCLRQLHFPRCPKPIAAALIETACARLG
jgi:CheY-like chemotaxis protein